MVSLEQFACRIPSSNAVKLEVLYCATNATNSADIWVAMGTCAAAIFAAAAVLLAFYISRSDKARYRRQEVREAIASLIQAVHDLAQNSKDGSRNNELDRNKFYRQSVLFELTIGENLNHSRFNAAANWLLKASRLRFDFTRAASTKKPVGDEGTPLPESHGKFLDTLTHHTTVALRDFDRSGNSNKLLNDLAFHFGKTYDSAGLKDNPEVEGLFTSGNSLYKQLIGSQPEYSPPGGPINLKKAYSNK